MTQARPRSPLSAARILLLVSIVVYGAVTLVGGAVLILFGHGSLGRDLVSILPIPVAVMLPNILSLVALGRKSWLSTLYLAINFAAHLGLSCYLLYGMVKVSGAPKDYLNSTFLSVLLVIAIVPAFALYAHLKYKKMRACEDDQTV